MVFNFVQIVVRKWERVESGHGERQRVLSYGKPQMLNFGGSDSRTAFLLKFGFGFSEDEGEEWITVS